MYRSIDCSKNNKASVVVFLYYLVFKFRLGFRRFLYLTLCLIIYIIGFCLKVIPRLLLLLRELCKK